MNPYDLNPDATIDDSETEVDRLIAEGVAYCAKNRTSEALGVLNEALKHLKGQPYTSPVLTKKKHPSWDESSESDNRSINEILDCEEDSDDEDLFNKADEEFCLSNLVTGLNLGSGSVAQTRQPPVKANPRAFSTGSMPPTLSAEAWNNGPLSRRSPSTESRQPPAQQTQQPQPQPQPQPQTQQQRVLYPPELSSLFSANHFMNKRIPRAASHPSSALLGSSPTPTSPAAPSNGKSDEANRNAILLSYVYYHVAFCTLVEGSYSTAERYLMNALESLPEQPPQFRMVISSDTSPLTVTVLHPSPSNPAGESYSEALAGTGQTTTQISQYPAEEHRSSVYSLLGVVHQKLKRYHEAEGHYLLSIELRKLIGSRQDASSYCNLSTVYLIYAVDAINKAKSTLHTMLTSKSVPPGERKRIREESRVTFKKAKSLLGLAKKYTKLTKTYVRPTGEDDHLLAGSKRNLISIESCLEDIRLSKSGRKDALSPTNVFQHPKEFISLMQMPVTALKRAHRLQRYRKEADELETKLAREKGEELGNVDSRGYLLGERGSAMGNKFRLQQGSAPLPSSNGTAGTASNGVSNGVSQPDSGLSPRNASKTAATSTTSNSQPNYGNLMPTSPINRTPGYGRPNSRDAPPVLPPPVSSLFSPSWSTPSAGAAPVSNGAASDKPSWFWNGNGQAVYYAGSDVPQPNDHGFTGHGLLPSFFYGSNGPMPVPVPVPSTGLSSSASAPPAASTDPFGWGIPLRSQVNSAR